MAVKTKEEILESIKSRFSDDTSDEALAFLEDVSDTFADYEQKIKGDGKDWKTEAERIDAEWRQKYKDRFFSGSDPEENVEDETEDKTVLTYEELFKEE